MKFKYSIIALASLFATQSFAEKIQLDQLSVTATKIEKATKDVSQSIAVVDSKEIDDKNILQASEVLNTIPGVIAESSSSSASPRLIIRGAGLKARYGVREIMVIKDGVPMTDPDSFTRFDFIDMQDVEQVEVFKGPGSVFASNATGGVVQLITKSVFDESKNRVKMGVGDENSYQTNIKFGGEINQNNYFSTTFSTTGSDNDWRDNNEVSSEQISLKHGYIFEDDATLESELTFTNSEVQLPASMNQAEYKEFESSGEQHNTSSAWQHSSRDSKILSLNMRYEKEVGNITFKPRIYANAWEHFHPVTGAINDSDDNKVFGTDLEANYTHTLFNDEAVLVFGITAKTDRTRDAKKYAYQDYKVEGRGSVAISQTLSDDKGDLVEKEESTATLYGAYLLESFKPTPQTNIDVSLRVDKISFDIEGYEYLKYNWSGYSRDSVTGTAQTYNTGDGEYKIDESYTLVSPKIGISYALTDTLSTYASVASANQAPTSNELGANQGYSGNASSLDKTTSMNYEIGLKARTSNYSYDLAIYHNDVDDEITASKDGYETYYTNAGKTQKQGLEFTGAYHFTPEFSLGASYAYSRYKFDTFNEDETISSMGVTSVVSHDRSDNYLPYIPKHKYTLFATMNLINGFKSRIESTTSGSYYMDNANSEKYDGYDFITNFMVGYEKSAHNFQLNIKNLFDENYATEASKDLDGEYTYKAAAPRMAMFTYTYKF